MGKIPWGREWLSIQILLPGKSQGQKSLVGYSPWGRKELDATERLPPSLLSQTLPDAALPDAADFNVFFPCNKFNYGYKSFD